MQIAIFFFISAVGALVFQNCASYESAYNPLYDTDLGSECIGLSCSTDAQAILLSIANQEPVELYDNPADANVSGCTAGRCVDIAGYCDVAGFPESTIYAEIQGSVRMAQTDMQTGCDENGRFRFLLKLPNNFPTGEFHNLIVTLVAFDELGREVINPAGLHRKQIGLLKNPAQ